VYILVVCQLVVVSGVGDSNSLSSIHLLDNSLGWVVIFHFSF
jgi:hypothetical protein